MGSCSLLQGIFPTQSSNLGLLHCRWILYHLSHQGSPGMLEWLAYPFSSRSSWPMSRTGVSCIADGFFTSWATREALYTEGWSKDGHLSWSIKMINTLGPVFPHHLLMARFLLSLKLSPFLLWVCNTKLICVIHFALTECQGWTNNLIWKIVSNCLGKLQLFLFWGCLYYKSSGMERIDPNMFVSQK